MFVIEEKFQGFEITSIDATSLLTFNRAIIR